MCYYTRRKKVSSWKSRRIVEKLATEEFDGVWGSPRAAGPCVSPGVRINASDQW